jgi:hypothetical protein
MSSNRSFSNKSYTSPERYQILCMCTTYVTNGCQRPHLAKDPSVSHSGLLSNPYSFSLHLPSLCVRPLVCTACCSSSYWQPKRKQKQNFKAKFLCPVFIQVQNLRQIHEIQLLHLHLHLHSKCSDDPKRLIKINHNPQ